MTGRDLEAHAQKNKDWTKTVPNGKPKAGPAKRRKKTKPEPEISLDTLREIYGNRHEPQDVLMPETKMIPVGLLNVDPVYQRGLSVSHVNKMLSEFESNGVGLIYVGRRKDGSYWVVDGQQRLKLLKYLGIIFPDKFKRIPCEVFESRGERHEAALYRVRNHKKKMSPLDIFKAKFVARDADTLTILRIINKRGLKIKGVPMIEPSELGSHLVVACIGALEKAYDMGKKIGRPKFVLERTVDSIRDCWGLDEDAFKNFLISGFSYFFSKNPEADAKVIKSSMVGKKPNGIRTKADAVSGFNRARNIGHYILMEFNKKAGKNGKLKAKE